MCRPVSSDGRAGAPHVLTAAPQAAPSSAEAPEVALLDDEPLRVEPQERDPGELLRPTVLQHRLGAPLDGGAVAVHERRLERAGRRLLVRERRLDVVARRLRISEGMRLEVGAVGIERDDRLRLVRLPAALPGLAPALGGRARVHQGRRNSPRATTTADPPTSTRSTFSAEPSIRAKSFDGRSISTPCVISISSPNGARPWRAAWSASGPPARPVAGSSGTPPPRADNR